MMVLVYNGNDNDNDTFQKDIMILRPDHYMSLPCHYTKVRVFTSRALLWQLYYSIGQDITNVLKYEHG